MERRQLTYHHLQPNDVANHGPEVRAHQSQRPVQLSVSHAEASGSSRMLVGTVGGDNIHGNVTHITNYYNSDGTLGDPDLNDPNTYQNFSSTLSDSEKAKLFRKLHFPQLDARLMNLKTARKRTCEWLLTHKDYQQWMDLDSKHIQAQDGLFWIRGNPGTGKSIAMKFLFQKMQNKLRGSRDELVLSFFFAARGSDLERSSLGLYRSLLFGLLSSEPRLLEVLDHCTRSEYLSILAGEWEQKHENLLQELCEKAIDLLVERKTRLYLYVDALDECPENQIWDIVTYFEEVMTEGKSRNIRVCLSSRHYPRISVKTKLIITLEHEASHSDDIKTYIRSELRLDEHTDQIEVGRLRDAIFQKSVGIFLWVSLVVRQLNDVFNNDGRMDAIWERLEEIPTAAKQTPLSRGDLPLYGLFEDVMMRDTKNIPDLVRLTQLIFCARRPLSPQEAFVALHQSYNERFYAEKVDAAVLSKQILAISKGLAEVTSAQQPTVEFIHETVRDFLRDGGLEIISKQSLPRDGNEMMKTSCLEQIKALDSVAERFEFLADYRTWTTCRNDPTKFLSRPPEGLKKQISQIFPFVEYAAKHILYHADAAAAQGLQQRSFLNSFPRHLWVALHDLFNTERSFVLNTPILYILAGDGINELVRISTDQQNYVARCEFEYFPTALHYAMYRGRLDTARVLVGLGPKQEQSPRLARPWPKLIDRNKTLLEMIVQSDDVDILRKIIQDHGVEYLQPPRQTKSTPILYCCRSATMVDCLVEHLMLPGIGLAEEKAQTDADVGESIFPTSGLFFIRRAIDKQPHLLTDAVWGRYCMLEYAIRWRLPSLVNLCLARALPRGLATLIDCLEHCAMTGWLSAVRGAHDHGVDLNYQDESGRTILHKMFTGDRFSKSPTYTKLEMCSTLQYLLFKSPKLGASVDRDGYTAFDLIRNDLWNFRALEQGKSEYEKVVKVFVDAKAMTKTGFICMDHQYPWVAVPWISVKVSMHLTGEPQFTKLNARDSLGRTALSWCFWSRPGVANIGSTGSNYVVTRKGMELLEFPRVDVNSRDNSGRTILEHLIRHPSPHGGIKELTIAFFKSSALDVNLETSDRQSPLDLVISLYGTWPVEFGEIDAEWIVEFRGRIKGVEKQLWLSEGLLETARLLMGTRKVDLSERKRCLAKAPDDLRRLILESIREVEPDYHLQTGSDEGQ